MDPAPPPGGNNGADPPPDSPQLRVDAVLEAIASGVLVQDVDGRVLFTNSTAAKGLGFRDVNALREAPPDAIARNIELFDEDRRRLDPRTLPGRNAVRSGATVERTLLLRVAEGERWYAVQSTPLRDAAGSVVGVVSLFHDVTDRRRLEEAERLGQEWFSTALRSIGDAVVTVGSDDAVTFMNPAAEALTLRPADDALGRPVAEVLRLVDARGERADLSLPVSRTSTPGDVSVRLRRPDGSAVPVEESVAPIRARDGSVAGEVIVLRDVSLRRREAAQRAFVARATELLASSLEYEETLSRIVALAVPAVGDWAAVDLTREGRIERVAVAHIDPERVPLVEEIERRWPTDPDEPRGVPRVLRTGEAEFVPEIPDESLAAAARDPEHLAAIRRLGLRSYMATVLRTREGVVGALSFATADSGRRFDADDLALAQALADRASAAIENARLYREAERARAEAEAANRAKDEFLAMLGHELRNPLAPIVTALRLMDMRGDVGGARERAVIDRQVRHLGRLVDDLLDVSRITSGRIVLHRERMDLADAVARAIELAMPLVEERGHRLAVDVPRGLVVDGDSVRLAQVASNLITNAAKYTERGGHIDVRAAREGAEVVLRVRDDGIGLAPDILPRVFDLFVQAPQAIDRARGGLGLGLSIVRALVRMHGGTVTARSGGAGQGSEFELRLPALAAPSTPPPAPPTPSEPARVARRILVVDDNADTALSLAEALSTLGHRVSVAHDGPSALAVAARARPEVAIVDLSLPVMDGIELAARLRALPGLGDLRLVAMTGYRDLADLARTRDAGFAAQLVKPVDLTQVVAAIA